jgi:hypothetical protein
MGRGDDNRERGELACKKIVSGGEVFIAEGYCRDPSAARWLNYAREKEPLYHKSPPFIPKKASGWRRDRKLREGWDTLKIMRLAALERTQMH